MRAGIISDDRLRAMYAGGRGDATARRAVRCRLVEIPVQERAPILKRYLAQVPGARPHVPVDRNAPLAAFAEIASRYPVLRVDRTSPGKDRETSPEGGAR